MDYSKEGVIKVWDTTQLQTNLLIWSDFEKVLVL